MIALRDNGTLIHDYDAFEALNGGEAMSDHQRGAGAATAPGHEIGKTLLHQPLILGVERTGGLIKQQYRCVAQHGARDGQTLTLAAG